MKIKRRRCLFVGLTLTFFVTLFYTNFRIVTNTFQTDYSGHKQVVDDVQTHQTRDRTDIDRVDRADASANGPREKKLFTKEAATSPKNETEQSHWDCRNPKALPSIDFSQKWFQVLPDSKKLYVFSAFVYVTSASKFIRLIGATTYNGPGILLCQLWFSESDWEIAEVVTSKIPENHGMKYSAAYYTCKLSGDRIPIAVSIVKKKCDDPVARIPVIHNTDQTEQFTVCVTPLNYKYGRAFELVSIIESNRVLGADRFVFYNYSTNTNVDDVLRKYSAEGIVEVVQWHLPMAVNVWPPDKSHLVEIHYFGQLGALNDCLYRSKTRSKYVVFTDLDELIVPRKHNTWKQMLDTLPPTAGSYVFRCVFFRKEWPDFEGDYKGRELAKKFKIDTVVKQYREKDIFRAGQRSKLIVTTDSVVTMGIHNVWHFSLGGKGQSNIDPSVALLHHYRSWNNPSDAYKRIPDTTIQTFANDIIRNVEKRWSTLPGVPLNMPRDFEKNETT